MAEEGRPPGHTHPLSVQFDLTLHCTASCSRPSTEAVALHTLPSAVAIPGQPTTPTSSPAHTLAHTQALTQAHARTSAPYTHAGNWLPGPRLLCLNRDPEAHQPPSVLPCTKPFRVHFRHCTTLFALCLHLALRLHPCFARLSSNLRSSSSSTTLCVTTTCDHRCRCHERLLVRVLHIPSEGTQ